MKRSILIPMAVLAVCFSAMIFTGCWDKTATPAERASVVSENATNSYIALYNTYRRLEGTLTGDDLVSLKKDVAPVMNRAKRHLIAYNDLVIQWRESGAGDKPMEIVTNERLLNSLLAEVSSLLIEFY